MTTLTDRPMTVIEALDCLTFVKVEQESPRAVGYWTDNEHDRIAPAKIHISAAVLCGGDDRADVEAQVFATLRHALQQPTSRWPNPRSNIDPAETIAYWLRGLAPSDALDRCVEVLHALPPEHLALLVVALDSEQTRRRACAYRDAGDVARIAELEREISELKGRQP